MSIPFSNTHYRIPQGFGNLLEGLTREILREQPENIPAFAAAYFENLLEKRESKLFLNRLFFFFLSKRLSIWLW